MVFKLFSFISLGTKWCGPGHKAKHYNDLGKARRTDICCRAHDKCKPEILPFRSKYGRWNFGFTTLKGCHCEYALKRCLSRVHSAASRMTYFSYFKVLKTPCLVFRKKRVCVKRSWFSCKKYGYRKYTVLKKLRL